MLHMPVHASRRNCDIVSQFAYTRNTHTDRVFKTKHACLNKQAHSMLNRLVQAYDVLNDPSLTPSYSNRKAKAYLRNAMWFRNEIPSDLYYVTAELAIQRLSEPALTPDQRRITTVRVLAHCLRLE